MQISVWGRRPRFKASTGGGAALGVLGAALVLSCLLSTWYGATGLPLADVWTIVRHRALGLAVPPDVSPRAVAIVWDLRLPRVVTGALVGAALAAGGATLQALVRNSLADPYLLGISSGASLGAALCLALGAGAVLGGVTLVVGAFCGAVLAVVLLLALVRTGGRTTGSQLVLAGLVVSYFLAALTNLVVSLFGNRDTVRAVLFWTLGSLSRSDWGPVPVLGLAVGAMVALLTVWARSLDAITLGDDVARSMGRDPDRVRLFATLVTAVGVSAAVAVSGAVGFVGLVVPHIARRWGQPGHRWLIPASALLGALVIVWGDLVARTIAAPSELPLGVLTALLGTPLLMLLMRRQRAGVEL